MTIPDFSTSTDGVQTPALPDSKWDSLTTHQKAVLIGAWFLSQIGMWRTPIEPESAWLEVARTLLVRGYLIQKSARTTDLVAHEFSLTPSGQDIIPHWLKAILELELLNGGAE